MSEKPAPCSRRQFLYTSSLADVTLFGGAAGSGKSEIAVIDFCPYVRIPNFIGIITRRTTTLLKGAGGILTKCKRVFAKEFANDPDYTFNWKEKDNKFVFYKISFDKSGKRILTPVSEVYLKHSEHENDIESYWQGIEANMIVIDESTQYSWPMVNYIMSRMRNPSCPEVKPRIKMTCNPLKTHFLRKWVDPYLKEDGTPDRSKDGLIRYFQMVDGEIYFADTKEQVAEYAQCSLDDVLSFVFISSTVADNKILQEIDPRYVSWLKGLKGVDRRRLLLGDWNALETQNTYFNRNTVTELVHPPSAYDIVKLVRAYDFASTLPHDANRSPDFFASVKMAKLRNGEYVILDVRRTYITFGQWESYILALAASDGKKCEIVIPQDPNPQAKANAIQMAHRLCQMGYVTKVRRSSLGKLEAFQPFAASAELGCIHIVQNCATDEWFKIYGDNGFFYNELEAFNGERKSGVGGHDDMVDSCSLAYSYLSSKIQLGNSFLHGIKNTDLSNKSGLLQIGR